MASPRAAQSGNYGVHHRAHRHAAIAARCSQLSGTVPCRAFEGRMGAVAEHLPPAHGTFLTRPQCSACDLDQHAEGEPPPRPILHRNIALRMTGCRRGLSERPDLAAATLSRWRCRRSRRSGRSNTWSPSARPRRSPAQRALHVRAREPLGYTPETESEGTRIARFQTKTKRAVPDAPALPGAAIFHWRPVSSRHASPKSRNSSRKEIK